MMYWEINGRKVRVLNIIDDFNLDYSIGIEKRVKKL